MSKDTRAKIGIFSLTLLSMASLGITPSIALIMQAFPQSSATEVQQLTAIPNLMAIVVAVVFSVVANKVPRKVVAVCGPLCVAVGGLLPVFVNGGLEFLLVCSGIVGMGVGLISNITQVLITELISPEERQTAMAQNVIFVNVGAIFMTTVGGMLASGGWQQNYLVYLIAVPVLLLALVFIPMYRGDIADAKVESEAPDGKRRLGSTAFIAALVILVFNCVYSAFPNNAALVLQQNGLGDASMAGIVNAVGTLGGLVAGLVLGKLLKYFQRFSLPVGIALMGVAMLAFAFAGNVVIALVAAFFIGFALSIGFAQCPFIISISTAPAMIPTAMAVYSIGSSLGGTVSPSLINAIAGATTGATGSGCCIVAGAIAIVACAVLLATRFQSRAIDKAMAPKEGK